MKMLETNFEMLTTVLGQKLQNDKKKIDFTCPLEDKYTIYEIIFPQLIP
jgi:hypothetical protein